MKNAILACAVLSLSSCTLPAGAQPATPPADVAPRVAVPLGLAPVIEPQARDEYQRLMARYAAFTSYSDTTALSLQNAGLMPEKDAASVAFRARLSWQRPGKVRLEGERAGGKFLAVSDGATLWARDGEHAGHFVRRAASPRIFEALNEVQAGAPGLGVMFGDGTLESMSKQGLARLRMLPDRSAEGVACRVLQAELADDDGSDIVVRFFVGAADGLMHRVENDYARGAKRATVVETHSGIKADEALPAASWVFDELPGTQAVEYFSSLNAGEREPGVKVGQAIPTFEAATLDGAGIKSSDLKGSPLVLHFFAIHNAASEVDLLVDLNARYHDRGLRVVGVSMDARRDRVQWFVDEHNIRYPVVFDGQGWKNSVATLCGVRSLPTTLLVGRDGVLQSVTSRPGSPEFELQIARLLR